MRRDAIAMMRAAARPAMLVSLVAATVLATAGGPARPEAAAVARSGAAQAPQAAGGPAPLTGLPGYKTLEARHPGSDAVVLFDTLVVSLDADGRVSRRRHRAVALFTDNAINRYGDPRILFDAARQDLTDITARVYMRDGTIVESQRNAINRTTPFALDKAPDYADWQETVVTHVGIEKGCVAELAYAIRDKVPEPWFSGVEIFSSDDPVEVRVLEVRAPSSSTLRCASLTGAPEADSPAPGIRCWTVRGIPGRTPFDGGAWEGDCCPVACYSTAAGWPSLLATIAAPIVAASRGADVLSAAVNEAVADSGDDEERVLAVHHLALGCVSSVRAPFGLLAAAPRDAGRIYESGYASPLDRAVLLAAMLRAAGCEPAFVLATPGHAWPEGVSAAELFTSIFVAVKTRDGELYLDPAKPFRHDTAFDLAGRTIARLDGEYPVMHLMERSPDESRSELAIVLTPDGDGRLAGEGTALLTGLFSPYFAMRGTESEAADYVKARVSGLFGGAELASWNPEKLERGAARIAFRFTVALPDAKPGDRAYLSIPRPFEAALCGIDRVHPERSSVGDAVRLEPCVLDVSCRIELSAGWKIVELPPPMRAETNAGSIRASVEGPPGGARTYAKTLTLAGGVVLPADYPRLRTLLSAFGEERLVLERE